jgi:calcineurin-like phosphoesterase family protein
VATEYASRQKETGTGMLVPVFLFMEQWIKMTIYFISDTHFSHANFLTFKDEGGERIRKEFESVTEMDEVMIERWNARVGQDDIIYHLGDVCFGGPERLGTIMDRLNGRKRLILGNHDREEMSIYRKYFQKIASWRYFSSDVTGCDIALIACHYALHPETVGYNYKFWSNNFCVHGHSHRRKIPDPRYINVCVENTGYAPISLEEILTEAKSRITKEVT